MNVYPTETVTITISRHAAYVALDNLYERLREENATTPFSDDDPTVASLSELVCALEAQGVSR